MARNSRALALSGICPTESGFDFLQGAYPRKRRQRHVLAAIAVIALVAVAVLAVIGVQARMDTSRKNVFASDAHAAEQSAMGKIAQVESTDGVGTAELSQHVEQRKGVYLSAVSNEMNVVAFLTDIENSAPAGTVVTSIVFAPPEDTQTDQPDPAAATDGSDTATPAAPTFTSTLGKVTVSGTGPFGAIPRWQSAMSAIQGLTGVDVSWSGPIDATEVQFTATISRDGLTQRAVDANQLGMAPTTPGASVAPAGTSPAPATSDATTPDAASPDASADEDLLTGAGN